MYYNYSIVHLVRRMEPQPTQQRKDTPKNSTFKTPKKKENWFSDDMKRVCRSVTFNPNHVDFLLSPEMEAVINNPHAAIEIHDVIKEEGGGIQLNSHSRFGNVVPIFDVKLKIPLLTELSVEGSIVHYNEEYSRIQKKKIFKYCIANKHEITIKSFSHWHVR